MVARPFVPPLLPTQRLDWGALVPRIARAQAAVARYDGLLQGLVNPELVMAPLQDREAVLSSRIEGTQATLVDVLEHDADPEGVAVGRSGDVREVVNYRRALMRGHELLETLPLSLRLIREVHSVLLEEVRGHASSRGEFRRIQNYIGAPGRGIEEAAYIPPPPNEIDRLLGNLEIYLHSDDRDLLVQIGLVHVQFEMIHPFLDGNGRVGRILIPLFLYARGAMERPALYLSAYFESHRSEYYRRLTAVSEEGDYEGWIEFFLDAVSEQAGGDADRVRRILDLYEETKEKMNLTSRSRHLSAVLDGLFRAPVFSTRSFARDTGIPAPTAAKLLRRLGEIGLIVQTRLPSGRRPAIWSFPALLDLLR